MKLSRRDLRRLIESVINEDTDRMEVTPGEVATSTSPDLSTLNANQIKYILKFAVDNEGKMIDVYGQVNGPAILADPNSKGDRSYVYAMTKGKKPGTPKITIVRSPKSIASFAKPREVKPGGRGYKAIKKLFDTGRDSNFGAFGKKLPQKITTIK